jgi:hypothetical protein
MLKAGGKKQDLTPIGKKPQTTCAITNKGRKAFTRYLDQLEQIIRTKKNKAKISSFVY